MRVKDLMSTNLATCRPDDPLATAAQLMWERDCGVVPVTDGAGRLLGVVTDRDACMAAYTQGRTLHAIPVEVAMARRVVTLHEDDPLPRAHELMRTHRLRRLPVVDAAHHVVGLLSLKDLALEATAKKAGNDRQEVARTLAEISRQGVTKAL